MDPFQARKLQVSCFIAGFIKAKGTEDHETWKQGIEAAKEYFQGILFKSAIESVIVDVLNSNSDLYG
jgi:hypothetical protein